MIQNLIKLSLRNRYFVLLIATGLFIWGIFAVRDNPIDAIPDLSENQVIVFTEWMGRSPQIIEDQVTFPLVSNLQGIPKIKNIRAYLLTTLYNSFMTVNHYYQAEVNHDLSDID